MPLTTFDFYNQPEIPVFSLANPDGTSLYNLGTIYDRKLELRYNTLSTLTFTAPSLIDKKEVDYYNYLQYKRIVNVDGIGNFMITAVDVTNDGIVEIKKITCKSLEVILTYKKLSLYKGIYTFNNSLLLSNGEYTTNLLSDLIENRLPGWALEYCDPELKDLTRSFDITDKSIYDFMMNDVSQTYQCAFVFDTINKKISAYSLNSLINATDIFISFDNLMKGFTLKESSEEIVTSLNVLGGEGVYLAYVNPLGNSTIYKFDYYMDESWMPSDLIKKLENWQYAVYSGSSFTAWAGYSTAIRSRNQLIAGSQTDVENLLVLVSASQTLLQAYIQGGSPTQLVSASIAAANAQIASINEDIDEQEELNQTDRELMADISTSLSMNNFFTSEEMSILDNYIIGNTYTNTTYSRYKWMTEYDVQLLAEELYANGKAVLDKISRPRYTIEIDTANFLFLKDFEPFINQLQLGSTITVELKEGEFTEFAVLGIDFSYDNPEDFKMTLSNRYRLTDEQFRYSDLFDTIASAGITTNYNAPRWNTASDALSGTSGSLVIGMTTAVAPNNIALFYDTSGAKIKDGTAIFMPITQFDSSLHAIDPLTGVDSINQPYTYSSRVGYYTITGRVVTFELYIALSAVSGAGTGCPIYIDMPTYHNSTPDLYTSFAVNQERVNLDTSGSYSSVFGLLSPSSKRMFLYEQGDKVVAAQLTAEDIKGNTVLYVSGQYLID